MSRYEVFRTSVTEQQDLLDALAENGFPTDKVEVHTEGVHLYGYQGDRRSEKAEIVIRRQHIGTLSNDVGFRKTDSGFEVIVSEYDKKILGKDWWDKIRKSAQAIAGQRVFVGKLTEQGFTLVDTGKDGSKRRLVMQRRA